VDVEPQLKRLLRHLGPAAGPSHRRLLLTLIRSHDDLPDLAIQAAICRMERWPSCFFFFRGVPPTSSPGPNKTP